MFLKKVNKISKNKFLAVGADLRVGPSWITVKSIIMYMIYCNRIGAMGTRDW